MAVGGSCSVEGCNRTHMYNSPVCYKHKDNAEGIWWAGNEDSLESREPSASASLLYLVNPFSGMIWAIILSVVLMWISSYL